MSNYEKLYWLTRLDYIQGLLMGGLLLSTVALIIYYICGTAEYDIKDLNKEYGYVRKIALSVLISCSVLLTFIPSKNDMIMIYAGGKTMGFVQKDSSINKIPAQTTELIYNYLNKAIEVKNK